MSFDLGDLYILTFTIGSGIIYPVKLRLKVAYLTMKSNALL